MPSAATRMDLQIIIPNEASQKAKDRGFPGGSVVKKPPATAGAWGQSRIQEDPTCCGATKPVHHEHCACALEPRSHNH